MTTIHDAYINALLADATYAINQDVGPNADLASLQTLKDRMTPTLAQFIGENFTVVTHIDTDDSWFGSGSGFDATVWRGKDGTEYAGKTYLSTTGTEGISDFITDIDLTVSGGATAQIISMVNWWLKNTTPVGQNALQLSDGIPFSLAPQVVGTGILSDITSLSVNGHSLGGHLATAFTRLFGGQWPVEHTYTYNSAGFTIASESKFQALEALLGPSVSKGYFEGIVGQTNFFAENGINATTRTFLNGQEGLRTALFNEETVFPINNHYMYKLTDALALGDAIAKLDSAFDIAGMNDLFDMGSSQTAASLEGILDGLRKIVLGGLVAPTPIGDVSGSDPIRLAYHTNLADIQSNPAYQSLIGKVQISTQPPTAAEARTDLSAFLSLYYLTPFVLKTTDAGALNQLYTVNESVATLWNADRNLTPEQIANGEANFSDQYLADRAKLLGWAQKLNSEDKDYGLIADHDNEWTFRDVGSDYQITIGSGIPLYQLFADKHQITFGSDSTLTSDTLTGGDSSDHLYGMGGNDYLDGKGGDDYLEGGTGSDILIGGSGNNILMGGQGDDVYYVTTGTGNTNKIIETREADGKIHGYLFIDGKFNGNLAEAQYAATGAWIKDPTRANTWVLASNPKLILTHSALWKIVTDDGSEIELGEFQDGDFGIKLIDPVVTLPENTRLIRGDFAPIDFDSEADGIQTQKDSLGNIITDPAKPEPNRSDVLYDSAGDDHIISGGGDDHIYLIRSGNDWVQGGDGRDTIDGSSFVHTGNNIIEGNAGADLLMGGNGNDTIFAGDKINLDTAIAQGETEAATAGEGEWLDGHGGIDTLVGGATDDVLMGGEGDDLLIGGGGDDTIYSDGTTTSIALAFWSVSREIIPMDDHTEYQTPFAHTNVDVTASGNDIVMGGLGRDWIFAGSGDDQVYGGNDDDVLFGQAGNNYLDGGNGDDIVVGGLGDDYLVGGDGDDTLHGTDYDALDELGNDTLDGGIGNDRLSGFDGNDLLLGGGGDDSLFAGKGNDVLEGGVGVDYMNGEEGDDVYRISAQDAKDTIEDSSGKDSLELNVAWQMIQVGVQGTGTDIALSWDQGSGSFVGITGGTSGAIESFQFSDRTVSLAEVLKSINPEDYKDVTGSEADPVLTTGGAAANMSNTALAADTTYLIQNSYLATVNDAGGVADTVDFGSFNSSQASYIRLTNDDLLVTLDTGAEITIKQHFSAENVNKIEFLKFVDTTMDTSTLDGLIPTIANASQGNDTLLGTSGDDILNGWVGNDTLVGGVGNDTYEFYRGDGNDLIDDNDATLGNADSILFMDVASTEVALERVGTNLVILSGPDSVTVKSFFEGPATEVENVEFSDGVVWNVADIKAQITIDGTSGNDLLNGFANSDDRIYGFAGDDQLQGFSGNDLLDGGTGDDMLFGQEGDDQLIGGDGNDVLVASSGNDSLNGDGGDDTLYGQEGDDQLNGGSGNDTLIGNSGNDTYVFNLGWGQDVIWEETDTTADVLQFGVGISPEDIMAVQSGADLILYHSNNVDQIRITNWYANPAYQVSRFEFADSTVWTAQEVNDRGSVTLRGTLGSDAMTGTSLSETLYGLDGDDSLNGAAGNDILVGGRGNDTLSGSTGTNTYLFAEGDGQDLIYGNNTDTLRFVSGINSSDISVERVGSDLILRHSNGIDGVTIVGWYSQTSSRIAKVTFASEATVWQTAQLDSMGINFSHNYVFDIGMGDKIILDWGGQDSLVFGAGIADAHIVAVRDGLDLKLNHVNGSDSFTVKDWFNDINRQIETVSFSESGNFLTATQLTTPFLTLVGTDGNDLLQGGNAYAETLSGLAGDDTINGGGGNDQITGGAGNDLINGGDGVDTYYFSLGDGQDTIIDTSNDNTIIFGPGLMGSLTVTGGTSGQDTKYTFGTGADSVTVKNGSQADLKFEDFGTAGADVMNGSSYGDVIHGLDGNDTLNGNSGADILYGEAGNDTLVGGSNTDYLYGGDGDDILDGNLLTGSTDSETYGSNSQDYYFGGKGNDTLYGNSSADMYYFNLGDGNDVITEGYYNNGAWRWSTGDKLVFGAGITAENVSYSKLGDDLFVSVSLTDSVTIKNWFVDSMAWVDYFSFSDGSTIYAKAVTSEALTIHGSAGNDVMTGHATFDDVLYGEAGDDTLDGQGGDDFIDGGEGNDQLYGRDGNDVIYGGSGNDQLFGGAGSNTLAGGAGDDLIYGGGSGGVDYYRFSLGDGHDVISDSGGSDSLYFYAPISASDIVSTRIANDLVLAISNTDDSVTLKNYFGQADYSFSYGGVSYRRSGYTTKIENIGFGGGGYLGDFSIRGAETNDDLSGSDYSDVMYGNAGNDVLRGLGDEDTLYGDDGDDRIYGDNADDNLSGGAGNDYLDGGDGTDLLDAGDGNDTLQGGASTDYLIGGYGSDSYLYAFGDGYDEIWDYGYSSAQDLDQILLAEGIDITDLGFSRSSDSLQVHVGSSYILVKNQYTSSSYGVERIQFADGGSIGLTDIQTATAAGVMNGTNADSILTGSSSADTLYGNDGNDWLDGSLGADKLIGGKGDDRYFVDNRNDVVTELADGGLDTIYTSSISFTAAANVENLVLTGSAAINATGNTLNNYLRGNSANNTLSGGGGNDILLSGDGTDILKDTAGNNVLHGGAGADTFTGATGNELFIGGTGNDTITTGTGYDVIVFNKGDGQDAINVSAGLDNTLSLGGGVTYSDLSLSRSGKNLILKAGATDQITLTNWYAKSTNRSVLNMQVIAEAMADFSAGSADPLRNDIIETFDFAGLVAEFDAAGAPANWQLTDARLTAHLKDGSDIAAIGGDLAYQYGMNGSLTGIGLLAAQNVINAAVFGQSAQLLNSPSSWQAETVRLA